VKKIILLIISFWALFINFGASIAEQQQIELLNDSETTETINRIIAPLCEAAGIPSKKINLYIVIDKDINAFVMRGGDLFLNTGLITAFNDPDVLKGVVAHELSHLSSGHVLLRQTKIEDILHQSWVTTLLGISAAAAGSPDLGTALVLGGSHVAERRAMRYSREQETVADSLGMKYLHSVGNTAGGFIKLLEHFNSSELYSSSTYASPYMLTHPLSKERLKRVREAFLQEKDNLAIRPSSAREKEAYARVVAKLRAFLETKEYMADAKKDLTGFAKSYGDAIVFYRTAQFDKSFELLSSLIRQHKRDGYLYELKGQFLFETGQLLPAVEEYRKAISFLGDKSSSRGDYAIVLISASKLYKERSHQVAALNEAILVLNKVLDTPYQRNPYIYRNLAIAYGSLGKIGYSNLMLAEEALLLQRKEEAEDFLRIAKNYAGQDAKLKLKIEDIGNAL